MKISILLVFLSIYLHSSAQNKQNNEWVVGLSKVKLNFIGDTVIDNTIDTADISYFAVCGNSNICDANGKLLFFASPFKIFNGITGKVMEGGESINNDSITYYEYGFSSYSNTTIILPKGNNQYYVFINTQSDAKCHRFWQWVGDDYDHDEIIYSIVDMNANNGEGKVIANRKILIKVDELPWLNKTNFTATRHSNGRDWWLIKPCARDRFKRYKFLVQSDTIIRYNEELPHFTNNIVYDNVGQSCFSADGSLYAENNDNCPHTIWNFDRCSGEFTLKRIIDLKNFNNDSVVQNPSFSGVCFSPNNRYLYAVDDYWVYQIDLENSNDTTAVLCVSEYDTSKYFDFNNSLQLTPTGQIFIGHWSGQSKDVNAIMKPNEYGKACQFKFNFCSPEGYPRKNTAIVDPPNMPFYALGALPNSPCDTIRIQPANWLLYPNPTTENIKLKVPNSTNGSSINIVIYDMLGQMVNSNNYITNYEHELSINAGPLAGGVYILKAYHGSNSFISKFVKK